jgi:4-amino-4-deoxy-L-arabinose transferase-like glycosyltransferase
MPTPAQTISISSTKPTGGFLTDASGARGVGGPTRATWACFAVCAAGFLGLMALVLLSPAGLWRDEIWYLPSVAELHRLGLSRAWLHGLPGPAGPLYAVVHAGLEPLTHLRPLGIRFATAGLTVLTVLALGVAMRLRGIPSPFLRAPALIAAPVLAVSIGTAMTEMPALLFFCASLAALLAALGRAERARPGAIVLAALAGLCCGVAITGRQQYLIALFAAVVLWRRATWRVPAVYLLLALAVPAPMFLEWRGLVPPLTRFVGEGISIVHGLLAFCYAGLIYCLYDVSWLARRRLLNAALIALAIGLNVSLGLLTRLPFHDLAHHYLPPGVRPYYGLVGCGAMLGFGIIFLGLLIHLVWERRDDPFLVFLCLASVLLLAGSAKTNHIFASRYIATALPMMVIIGTERAPDTYGKAARLALGCVGGMLSLASDLTLI